MAKAKERGNISLNQAPSDPSIETEAQPGYDFIVVANRLPIDRVAPAPSAEANADPSGSWRVSPGGLVAAMDPVMRSTSGAWVGWPGVADETVDEFDHDGMHLVPISLSEADIEEYYEGFANATIWPLYHDLIARPEFHRTWWDRYVAVNRTFAERTVTVAAFGATVWVHDYQLQLVPRMLRELRPDLVIGYFHHIPFPPYELFGQLPWRAQVLDGLLGADLVGFQRTSDAQNFQTSVRRALGFRTKSGVTRVYGGDELPHLARSGAYPISIDTPSFVELVSRPEVQARAAQIREQAGNPKVLMLGVDRLDYTKGIRHRLKAYGELLAERKLEVPHVSLVQIATPSRDRIEDYRRIRHDVELEVGRINGEYAGLGSPAVHYLHHTYPRDEMAAYFLAADVLLVTALRDGMNLVVKEYIASRRDNSGVVVLSEFTGAADELPQSIIVNPYDIHGLKAAIVHAVTMSTQEAAHRMRRLRRRVRERTVTRWAEKFLRDLRESAAESVVEGESYTGPAEWKAPSSLSLPLLVALDFDGVLAPFVAVAGDATPMPESTEIVRKLSKAGADIAYISGRALADLKSRADAPQGAVFFGSHGGESSIGGTAVELTDAEEAQLDALHERLHAEFGQSDAHIGRKPLGYVVHTRGLKAKESKAIRARAVELASEFDAFTMREGSEVVEFAIRDVTKGDAIETLRLLGNAGTILYIGDDVTDEDAFRALRPGDIGVKVGSGPSAASRRVSSIDDVPRVLADVLAALRK